jgi:hypothetical protein
MAAKRFLDGEFSFFDGLGGAGAVGGDVAGIFDGERRFGGV